VRWVFVKDGGWDEVLGEAGGECICRTRERGKSVGVRGRKEWVYDGGARLYLEKKENMLVGRCSGIRVTAEC
jgi:hypothetical protein